MDGCLLTALSVWEFCALAAQKQFTLEPQPQNWPLVTSRFLTPFFLLPEPVIISSNLAGEKQQPCPGRQQAFVAPLSQAPYAFQHGSPLHSTGTPTWPQPLLTCRASLICIRMLLPHLCGCIGLHHLHCSSLPLRGLLKARCSLCHPSEHSWCTRSLSVLGPVSSLLPAWPLLSTNTSLPPSLTLGLPEAQPFTLDTH